MLKAALNLALRRQVPKKDTTPGKLILCSWRTGEIALAVAKRWAQARVSFLGNETVCGGTGPFSCRGAMEASVISSPSLYVEPCDAQRCPIRGSLKAIPALGENWEVLWWWLPREATLSASLSSSWMCGGACPVATAQDELMADPRACEPELSVTWTGNGEAGVGC